MVCVGGSRQCTLSGLQVQETVQMCEKLAEMGQGQREVDLTDCDRCQGR